MITLYPLSCKQSTPTPQICRRRMSEGRMILWTNIGEFSSWLIPLRCRDDNTILKSHKTPHRLIFWLFSTQYGDTDSIIRPVCISLRVIGHTLYFADDYMFQSLLNPLALPRASSNSFRYSRFLQYSMVYLHLHSTIQSVTCVSHQGWLNVNCHAENVFQLFRDFQSEHLNKIWDQF